MYFLPSADVPLPHARVQAAMYGALEAMRIAVIRLDAAINEYDEDALLAAERENRSKAPPEFSRNVSVSDLLPLNHLIAARCKCHFFACIIEEVVVGISSVSDAVLATLRHYGNTNELNTPHIEGVLLSVLLAWRLLQEADDLSVELDGTNEWRPDYELIVAACEAMEWTFAVLDSECYSCDPGEVLDALMSGTTSEAVV